MSHLLIHARTGIIYKNTLLLFYFFNVPETSPVLIIIPYSVLTSQRRRANSGIIIIPDPGIPWDPVRLYELIIIPERPRDVAVRIPGIINYSGIRTGPYESGIRNNFLIFFSSLRAPQTKKDTTLVFLIFTYTHTQTDTLNPLLTSSKLSLLLEPESWARSKLVF